METIAGVYKITCLPTSQVYIGASSNIKARISYHKSELKRNRHDSHLLQNLFNEYGICAFKFEILESCQLDAIELIRLECKYYDQHKESIINKVKPRKSNIGPLSQASLQKLRNTRESTREYMRNHPDCELEIAKLIEQLCS